MKAKSRINRSASEKGVFSVFFVIYIVFALICIYPMLWCLINSFKDIGEYYENSFSLPEVLNFQNYVDAFKNFEVNDNNMLDMFFNSCWQTFGSCALNVIASFLVAYALARFKFPFKNLLYSVIIFRITIPIIGSAASEFNLFRNLNMVNNPALFWLAWLQGFDMTTLILYGYLKAVSNSYSEAAKIDGASDFRIMWQIYFPQVVPCVIALFINQVVAKWNDYSMCQIYLSDYPNLAYGLFQFKTQINVNGGEPVYFAIVLLTSIPSIIFYAIAQRTMVKNMSIGGLK